MGHRTIPMLLAKSSFKGDVKNWSTLINLYSQLTLEVTQTNKDVVLLRNWLLFRILFYSVMHFIFRFTIIMK